jgi:iron complex transport system substrate-binding protein
VPAPIRALKFKLKAVLKLALLLALSPALAGSPRAHAAAPQDTTVAARDDTGRRVQLHAPARRVIALSPGITESLFAIGAGTQVVGVSDYSDYPPAALALPRVARAQGIDLERIAALHPDLIVTWASGYAPAQLTALEALGVPVYRYEPRHMEDIARDLEALGTLTAAPDGASQARRLREGRARLAAHPHGGPPVATFFQVWADPLMTLSDQHLAGELIGLCGGRNVFGALPLLVAAVDTEAVLRAAPELIVAGSGGVSDAAALREHWKRYTQLPAVAHGQLARLDSDLLDRGGPRTLEGAQALCGAMDAARGARSR